METPARQVICRFCQHPTPHSPLEEMDRMGVDVYWCETCHAEYLYFKDSNYCNSCSLYTQLNDKHYRWTTSATGYAFLWYIRELGIPGKLVNRDMNVLFSLSAGDNQPDITPDNVARKIKTMLIFL